MASRGQKRAMRRASKSAARPRLFLRGWSSPWTKDWPVTTSWLVPRSGRRRRRTGERELVHRATAEWAVADVAARERQQTLLPGRTASSERATMASPALLRRGAPLPRVPARCVSPWGGLSNPRAARAGAARARALLGVAIPVCRPAAAPSAALGPVGRWNTPSRYSARSASSILARYEEPPPRSGFRSTVTHGFRQVRSAARPCDLLHQVRG